MSLVAAKHRQRALVRKKLPERARPVWNSTVPATLPTHAALGGPIRPHQRP